MSAHCSVCRRASKNRIGAKALLLAAGLFSVLAAPVSMRAQAIIHAVAGTGTAGYNGDGIAALSAELNTPFSTVADTTGNLYIADTYNQRIRKIDKNGKITTIAGDGTAAIGQLNYPFGLAATGSGDSAYIYIADTYNNRILKFSSTAAGLQTIAGSATGGFSGDGGLAVNAELQRPLGVAADSAGNVYIADTYNHRIRKVDTTGNISTVAGNGTAGYNQDAVSAVDAELNYPEAIAVDNSGNIYIADTVNARIRKVDTTGNITTVAGNGSAGYNGDGVLATAAELAYPAGVAVDSTGNLYIADSGNQRIRKVDMMGMITTVAGTGKPGYNGDSATAQSAQLSSPTGVAFDAAGNLYITDSQNQRVRSLAFTTHPDFTVSPGEFSFPQQPIGSTSSEQAFTVTNSSTAKVVLGTLSSTNAPIFPVLSDECSGKTLAPKATCQFSVAFSPVMNGTLPQNGMVSYSGAVSIPGNANQAAQTVMLTGTGLLQASNIALYSAVNPQFAGSKVIFTVTVTAANATGVPTGAITWQQATASGADPILLGQAQLVNGQAVFQTSFAVGTSVITATYSGDQAFAASSASLTQVIQRPLASLTTVSGSGQVLASGPAFPQPLVALVLNVYGAAVAGVPVQFSGPGLSFSNGGRVLSDANGHASVMAFASSTGSVTALATVAGLSPASFVLNTNPGSLLGPTGTFYAAGSTAQFNTFALAAVNMNQLCGTHHWTQRNAGGANAITVTDPRSSAISPQGGDIWIVWNDQAAAGQSGGAVCYFVAVDSVVAVRLYQARGVLNLPAGLIGSADANIVPYLSGTSTALPASIQAIVNGSTINVGLSDIRPEDAKFAINRALTPYGALMAGRGFTGVGYQGPVATPWLGQPILSAVSQAAAYPVDFAFIPQDVDPVNGVLPVRPYHEVPIGAAPVLVLANVSQTGSGHLGDGNYSNISTFALNKVLLGRVSRARDLSSSGEDGDQPVHVWINDPLSGAYNTIEFDVINSVRLAGERAQGYGRVTGQEANVLPTNSTCAGQQPCTAESGNPLFHPYGSSLGGSSSRGRVIGDSEMIATVGSKPDSLGYAFWSYGNFAGSLANNLKYLTVDGSDPLYSATNPNPEGVGVLPQCNAAPCVPPLDNIKNGTYPIWSIYRMLYDYTDSSSLATNLAALAQAEAATQYGDFVPAPSLGVFRSHFDQVVTSNGIGYSANNGFVPGTPETGGDMGGTVLTVQSELDFITDSGGKQQTNLKQ